MLALFPCLSSQIQVVPDLFAVRLAFHLYPYIMISGLGTGATRIKHRPIRLPSNFFLAHLDKQLKTTYSQRFPDRTPGYAPDCTHGFHFYFLVQEPRRAFAHVHPLADPAWRTTSRGIPYSLSRRHHDVFHHPPGWCTHYQYLRKKTTPPMGADNRKNPVRPSYLHRNKTGRKVHRYR